MQIPNLSLAYLAAELRPVVEGSILRKVQELENGWLKLRLQTRQGTKDLIAAPDAVFITGGSMPAKKTTSGYGAFLRKQIANKKVISLKQHGFDRILLMELEGFFLIFELFAKGNVILTDKGVAILSAFRKEQWKDRALRKGEPYKFPSSKGANPLELDENELKKAFSESPVDAVRTLIKEANIAPVFAEAACADAGVEKGKEAKKLSEKELASLAASVKGLYSVDLKKSRPVLVSKEGLEILLPFPLNLPEIKVLQEFPSINEALDKRYSESFGQSKGAPERASMAKKEAELRRSMQRQEAALEKLQKQVEENAEKAELIYANYTRLFELVEALKGLGKEQLPKEEVMYKIKNRFPFVKGIDFRARKLAVSLEK